MTDSSDLAPVLAALQSPRLRYAAAVKAIEPKPGLYALWADAATWDVLGLGTPPDDRPLYVGKSEDDLVERLLCEHFEYTPQPRKTTRMTSLTGRSSPRRSLAALLRQHLSLRAIPRNPRKPVNSAKYGLSPAHDHNLTAWMRDTLLISTWESNDSHDLTGIEDQVKSTWKPPLNLDVQTPWTDHIDTRRTAMAAEARAWTPPVANRSAGRGRGGR